MTANEKVARRKPSMLQLVEELSSVSEACRLMGYSRTQLEEVLRFIRRATEGLGQVAPALQLRKAPSRIPEQREEALRDLHRR